MTDYSELKGLAECAVGFTVISLAPDVVLELIAENERLERKNSNQSESIKQYQDQITGGDLSLGMLIAERNQLKAENEALRKALKTIREESHDLGACECAADALADASMRKPS